VKRKRTACAHRTGRASRVSTARGSEWAHPTRETVPDIRLRSWEDGGRLAPQFKTFHRPLQENPTPPAPPASRTNVIPEPPFAFVGLMGVARDIARAIAATAEGGPRRLRVNPALHTELSGVRGDKTHILVGDSQNGIRENSVYLRINLKKTMLRGAPVRGAPTF